MTPAQKLILMNHSEKLLLALQASTSALRSWQFANPPQELVEHTAQLIAYSDALIDEIAPQAPQAYPAEPLRPHLLRIK